MKLGYIRLMDREYPLCFSYRAAQAVEEAFGSLEAMAEQVEHEKLSVSVPATDTMLGILMEAGRVYTEANGGEVPPPIKCRPSDLLPANNIRELRKAFACIVNDSEREVEVEEEPGKNGEATQDEEVLRGCTTTEPEQG